MQKKKAPSFRVVAGMALPFYDAVGGAEDESG